LPNAQASAAGLRRSLDAVEAGFLGRILEVWLTIGRSIFDAALQPGQTRS